MQSTDENKKRKMKQSRLPSPKMPVTDLTDVQNFDDSVFFPIEEIVQYPLPGCVVPSSISFSPDDNFIAYLFSPDQTLNKKVFSVDLKTSEPDLIFSPPDGGLDESNISPEEKLRRERLRERGLGVTQYEWMKTTNSKKKAIMVPLPAGIYIHDIYYSETKLKLPSIPSSPIIDPHLSPDGSMLAYVRDSELHALDMFSNELKQLTHGAKESGLTHGLAEYIAQEEMDRKTGYWWSPDSKHIAFTEVDYSGIPLFRIMHEGKSSVGLEAQEDHPYPFAGASNAKVRLGVVSVAEGSTTWMDLQCGGMDQHNNEEEYLARVNWIHGNILIAQVLNRHHTKIKLLKFDIRNGQRKALLVEENNTWINLHDCFMSLDKGVAKFSGGFIWASEKTGFRHLYLHDVSGTCLGPITEGEWMVEQIAGVNEATGLIYFTGTLDGPMESNLYCAKLFTDGGQPLQAPVRLTPSKGKHIVVIDHRMQSNLQFKIQKLQLETPEIVEIQAKDGTLLFGVLYKPDVSRFGPPPYKTMINVYGGPSVQLVCNSWVLSIDMRAQYLRNQGILVWKLDNRGTARRGLKFESHAKHNLGQADADDQVTGAEWLIEQGLAKVGHIGLYGWSYGGYLSAMALARYPDTFKCAVAGAPVTSWDSYDTFYTESSWDCHMRTDLPTKAVLHTARLVNALVAARKPYELLIFPDERHMPRRHRDRLYLEERIWDFIQRNL
ncbi:hypothetical protein K1719_044785 [Acacia pycnantha]|nr:hypothetical protein K1719_044785 [Acacia pycnantha]